MEKKIKSTTIIICFLEIQESIAVEEAAEYEEKERLRLNPPLRLIETKEQGVQVRPESLIYYSP